jgi:hypothetical protein
LIGRAWIDIAALPIEATIGVIESCRLAAPVSSAATRPKAAAERDGPEPWRRFTITEFNDPTAATAGSIDAMVITRCFADVDVAHWLPPKQSELRSNLAQWCVMIAKGQIKRFRLAQSSYSAAAVSSEAS